MFSKLTLVVVTTMAVFVAAAPSGGINNSCNSGPVQCCNEVHSQDSDKFNSIKSLFNLDIPVGTSVGMHCSPLSGIGIGSGSQCRSQPVCCSDNKFNGLVVVGCSPININI